MIFEITRDNYGALSHRMLSKIVEAGQEAFGPGMSFDEVHNHVLLSDNLLLAVDKDQVVGFASSIIKPDSIYLAGAAIREAYQTSGIYKEFALRRVNLAFEKRKEAVTLRTQNPRIEAGVRSVLTDLRTAELVADFKVTRELQPKVYGRMLTAVKPFSLDEELNAVYNQLNYPQGDAYSVRFDLTYHPSDHGVLGGW